MMRSLHFEFELGALLNGVYNIQMRFPGTKWQEHEPLTISI